MTKRTIFLHSPSRRDAGLLGLGDWYEWFKSQGKIQEVYNTEAVSEGGIFVSFSPVCEEMDTFPELEGKAERWLALDSVGNATESCRIAEDAGVDRLLHAQLADELLSPVGPGALLYLMDRGIWLPNTINVAPDIFFPTVDAKANREEASVLFVLDDELAFCNDLRFPLKVLKGGKKAFGCRTREMSLRAFTLETLAKKVLNR